MADSRAPDTPGEEPIIIHPGLTGDEEIAVAPVTAPQDVVEPFDADGAVAEARPMKKAERAAGLDAFRGLFLLAMNFAFTVPFGVFAGWMYHIQYPSPSGEFAPIPGLGWRDTLFAGFLFAMAAALPITMGRRLEKGQSYPSVLMTATKRALLLFVFALIIGHVNPFWTGDYTKRGNVMAMVGFAVCFWVFTRRREDWDARRFTWVRRAGWVAVAALLFLGPTLYGETFSLERRDGIIAAIAFTALAGTALWLLTRRSLLARLAIVAFIVAVRTAARDPGWVQNFWNATPAPWLYESWYLELLLIVIPGTIAGDLLVRWMRPMPVEQASIGWSRYRLGLMAAAGLAIIPVVLAGTYVRAIPETAFVTIGLAAGGSLLFVGARTQRERVLASLFWWGAFWVALGIVLEPAEGGIKKVPQTLSYLTLTTGMSTVLLTSVVILADVFRLRRRLFRPLIEVGQNPMLAYVAYMLFISHFLYLVGFGETLTGDWIQATVRGFLFMGIVSFLVWLASRHKLYWRA